MHIDHLSLINFRNYHEISIDFSGGINCLLGHNGAGKTNLLDAIHYLSFCKSYFNSFDNQNILHEEEMFVIQGLFEKDGNKEEIYCAQKRNERKQFKRNKKDYPKLSEHIGLLPVVMITPLDAALLYDGSDIRRKFVDSIISQVDIHYLNALIEYNKALLNRNATLKQLNDSKTWDDTLISMYDSILVSRGKAIYKKRQEFTEEFSPLFLKAYMEISGEQEAAHVEYSSKLSEGDLEGLLVQCLPKDRVLGYTSTGVHKDDWIFCMENRSLKKFASQGQQKSFIIALKVAQYRYLKKLYKSAPILLLDDIFDKLDDSRVNYLIDMVCGDEFEQVFITDTNLLRMKKLLENRDKDYRLFPIANGKVQEKVHKVKSS
jgi:DNA replication and repair protein RecF